jgi:hypothetical protein
MAEQLESKTAIMLDQAQVDAAEAAADVQENGENGEHIGRRPESSGRDSKRYRKSFFVGFVFFPSAPPRPNAATCRHYCMHQHHSLRSLPSSANLSHSLSSFHSSCCATSSDAIHSSPTQPNT